MKRTLFYTFAAALLLGTGAFGSGSRAMAQEEAAKPVLVVSVTSVDKLFENAETLANIAGASEQARPMLGMARFFLGSIETSKPCGVVVNMRGMLPTGYGFIPVTNFKAVMQLVEGTDTGNGIYESNKAPVPVFFKEHNGWAFISNDADSLANLPDDPAKLLAGQEKEYDIMVRAYVKNIPDLYRQMAIDALESGIEGAEKNGFETDEEFEARMKAGKAAIGQFVALINDIDNVAIGWSVDEKGRKTFLDINMTAKPDSKSAKQFAAMEKSTTNFAGFLQSDAAMTFNAASTISSDDATQMIASLKVAREQALRAIENESDLEDDAAKEAVKSAVGDMMDVFASTIEGGKIDIAGALILKPEAMTFVAGVHVVNASKVEGALKKLAALAKENEPDFPGIDFDADQHNGVRFHTMSIPMDDAPKDARRLLGDKLGVALGFGESNVYMAVGKDSVQMLKDAIDRSASDADKSVPPVQLTFALGPILKFAASADPENMILGMVAAALEEHKGKDHVRIVARPIKNGASYRLEVEEGVLSLAGLAANMAGQRAGGGGDDGFDDF